MEDTRQVIQLHSAETFIPDSEKDAFLVQSGEADVFVVPWENGQAGRRVHLCGAPQGTVIPALVYRDRDYKHWRFAVVAREDTQLKRMPSMVTSVLLRRFAERAGLKGFAEEGFENSVLDFYKRESVKDNVFIVRGEQQEPERKKDVIRVIKGALDHESSHVEGNNAAYKAVAYVCRAMGMQAPEFEKVEGICAGHWNIPRVAQACNLICREIVLEPDWYKNDCGVIVGVIEKEQVVCLPKGRGYEIFYPEQSRREGLTKAVAQSVDPKAYSLGRTLPGRALKFRDLVKFCRRELRRSDLTGVAVLELVGILIGILLPTLNQKIYDDYIPLGNLNELFQICIVIGSFMVGNLFFSMVKSLCELRLQSRVGYRLQDAAYFRLFRLPESFFHDYESADLAQRLMTIGTTANKFISSVLVTGISTGFSLLYLVRMFLYSGKLSGIAVLMILVYMALLTALMINEVRFERDSTENRGKSSAKLYQYLSGIEKIRMAGVEDRAIYDYMIPFARVQEMEIRKNRLSTGALVLSGIASTVFSMVLYYVMVKSKVQISIGAFVGFNTAMGTFTASIQELVDKLLSVYQMRPVYDRFMPIFKTASEDQEDCELLDGLSGAVDVRHVSFSYGEGQKQVLDNIDLHVKKGEYLGIVGASGCGKSTLLKLLLGFETPNSGQITYDGHDLRTLDKHAFRKNLGVVLQNGRLIAGSIFENITITSPESTQADVMKVLEAVGLKEDVEQMPMGIHTVLSENSSTISGGQQQRILIARAIIRQPSILIFDEATSALDNLTQAAVVESLDKMHVTRIVVAHRLSTIRTCDRIIVMDDGRIVEEGNYDSLMEKRGLFYQLASRQIAQ